MYVGPDLCFYQVRMLLRLVAERHHIAQQYLESLNMCWLTTVRPRSLMQRDFKVKRLPCEYWPSLLARGRQWNLLRNTDNIYPEPEICSHEFWNPSPRTSWPSSSSEMPETYIESCQCCGTQHREDCMIFPHLCRPKLYPYLLASVSQTYAAIVCTTKWVNLGTLGGHRARSWWLLALDLRQNMKQLSFGPKCPSECFEEEDHLRLHEIATDMYMPVLNEALEGILEENPGLMRQLALRGWSKCLYEWLRRWSWWQRFTS